MIAAPSPAVRASRAPLGKTATNTPTDDAESQAQEQTLAVQRQAFDIQMEESAELERERQALEQLMLARLKDEDEVVKKFIELI